MKRISTDTLKNPTHLLLQQKDERELYAHNPLDYYAVHYRRRLAAITEIVRRNHAVSVLEVGCAQGNISLICAENGSEVTAVDINPAHLSYSRMKHEFGSLKWVAASADALPFKKGHFDIIILGELLEHCAWPEAILRKAAEILAPHGTIIITTPNNAFVHSVAPSFSSVADDRKKIESHQFGSDGDSHLFTFTPDELREAIILAGLRITKTRFTGNHFLHLPKLYHLRKALPFLFTSVFEAVIPRIPGLNRRYCETLLFTASGGKTV